MCGDPEGVAQSRTDLCSKARESDLGIPDHGRLIALGLLNSLETLVASENQVGFAHYSHQICRTSTLDLKRRRIDRHQCLRLAGTAHQGEEAGNFSGYGGHLRLKCLDGSLHFDRSHVDFGEFLVQTHQLLLHVVKLSQHDLGCFPVGKLTFHFNRDVESSGFNVSNQVAMSLYPGCKTFFVFAFATINQFPRR